MVDAPTLSRLPEASPYSRHLPALDGVRGLAILMVMCSHFFPGTPHNRSEQFVQMLLAFGGGGVDLFFVLSGFLITGILFDSLHEPHFFRKFYARRALRILPLYYVVIAVFAVIGLVQHRSSDGELLSLALYLQNTPLIAVPIFLYGGPLYLPLGHFWSLAIEEQFYLVWPLLVFLLRTRTRLLVLCTIFMFLCPILRFLEWQHGASLFSVHANTLFRADALLTGGALALLLRSRLHDQVLVVLPWLSPAPLLLLVMGTVQVLSKSISHSQPSFAAISASYSILDLGYAGLLALSLSAASARSFFSLKPLRALGKYSYGLYVLHLILLSYIQAPLRSYLNQMHVRKGVAVLLVGLTGFVISIPAAILSYQLYERRFLRLKRFFDYRPHGPGSASALAQSTSPATDRPPAAPALH